MNQQNNTHNQGDIATTLTIFAALVMTIGVIIGSVVVSSPQLTSLFTQAQSAQIEAVQGNNHEVSYTGITTRSIGNQKLIGGSICFKGGEPPSSGTYRVEVEMVTSGRNTNIGAAVTETFSGNSGISCPNSAPFNAAVISELPTGTSISDVQRIEIYVIPGNGGWQMSKTLIGIIGDPTAIFNVPPTQGTTPIPTTVQPEQCQYLQGKVPASVIAGAIGNPESIDGWNELENPNLPESSTNRRKRKLGLQNPNADYNQSTNPLVFKADCDVDSGTEAEACDNITSKIPQSVLAGALANPETINGWNLRVNPDEPESASNPRKRLLSLERPLNQYDASTNPLMFTHSCTPDPQVCSVAQNKIPAATQSNALSNPESVDSWNRLANPAQAESTSNRRQVWLTLQDINFQYHPINNPPVFVGRCVAPSSTFTPTPNATNTPTPAETRGARAEKTFLIINESSNLSIVEVSLELCIYNQSNTEECKTSRHDVNIPPYNPRNSLANRQYVTFNWQFDMLKNDIKNWKWGEYSEKLSDSTSNSAEIGTSIDDPDSVIGTITGGTESIESKIQTEFQAAEISGDSCVNSADAALITTRIGEESTVATCEQYDVDCNGIFNTFDLAYIIEHLNEGDGCVYNQTP